MAKALIPLAKGFEDVEAVTVIDVLRRGGVEVVTASLSGATGAQGGPAEIPNAPGDSGEVACAHGITMKADARLVVSAHGITMKADARLADVADGDFDAIVLPGGGEGTENLKNSDALIRLLQRQNDAGRWLCAICAAPTVLVEAGVLAEGLHVTCYPTCQMELDRPWSPVPVVVDGNVITGQAPGSALLFALVVLQTLTDEATARRVARGLVTDVLG